MLGLRRIGRQILAATSNHAKPTSSSLLDASAATHARSTSALMTPLSSSSSAVGSGHIMNGPVSAGMSLHCRRWFSSSEATADDAMPMSNMGKTDLDKVRAPFWTKPQVVSTHDGREFLVFRQGYHPKLKPGIVRKRIENLRTYEGKERSLKYSKWKLNLLCQFAAGMPVEEAIRQLKYQKKRMAPVVSKVIARTANLADIRHGLQKSALEVAECFATRGTPVKKIDIKARGRMGRIQSPRSHMRVVLREIDFQLKIYQARTTKEKHYWYNLQEKAEEDARRVQAQKEEEELLERENARKEEERRKADSS